MIQARTPGSPTLGGTWSRADGPWSLDAFLRGKR
jgi:hypothetical protein